ncbi:hypothetical protein CPB86DRAFT_752506 [Serendipita vermifera]|nr:hypothetical protein CPB86DRAFT_752506 [Serendipita vermifera]
MSTTNTQQTQVLRPRPKTHPNRIIPLMALLPPPPPKPLLPLEVWRRVFTHTVGPEMDAQSARQGQMARKVLLTVCRDFKEAMLPIFYSKPFLPSFDAFILFVERLLKAQARWDNLRRIQYSEPGRWVETLNLTWFEPAPGTLRLQFDKRLAQLFTVIPFLSELVLNPEFSVTRQTLQALAESEAAYSLKRLSGVHIPCHQHVNFPHTEALTNLLRACVNLKHLELVGTGLDLEGDLPDPDAIYSPHALSLPSLVSVSIVHAPFSPILQALAHADIPCLGSLTISVYTDVETSDATKFLCAHASKITNLMLLPAQTWPSSTTRIRPDILKLCPNLRRLYLPIVPQTLERPEMPCQVTVLSVPRPTLEFLSGVIDPAMPHLRQVQVRELKYVPSRLGHAAANTGNNRIMLEWRRKLSLRGGVVLDSTGRPGP